MRDYTAARATIAAYGWAFVIILLCASVHGAWPAFRYDASLPWAWRWASALTAQFNHLSWYHWGLNAVGLLLLCWGFAGWWTPRRALVYFAGSLFGVALGVLTNPAIHWYVGLSGALYGLLAAGCIDRITRRNTTLRQRLPAIGVLLAVAIKLWIDSRWPELFSADTAVLGGPVLPIAHVYGATSGAVGAWAGYLASSRFHKRLK
jgi:rhomboid family GlyGly-CTERM serine protease